MDYLFYFYRRRSTLICIIRITMMGIAYVILVAMKKNIIPYLTNVKSV